MNGRKWMNLLAVLSVGALHAESVFATVSSTVKSVEVRQANQQKNVVKGTVTDESGLPVPGASVVVVGTTEGTVTDMDGAYSLALSRNRAVLRFSFIGLKSVDVEYTGQRVLNVVLKSDNQVLDDVVVIGYGSKNRKSLTSSISSVKKDDLNKLSKTSSTVQDMLGGTIKGVLVTQNSGEPGATMTVNVRGITSPYPISTSLTANNAPLYVIDGVPMFVDSNALNPLMNIAPNDIESIDVLKDASSTAIYGARGANGVVIITTKGGHEGKTEVNFGASFGLRKVTKLQKVLSPYDYILYQREAGATDYYGEWEDMGIWESVAGTDYQDEIFGRTGNQVQYNANVSGGTKQLKYNVGYTHSDEKSIMAGSGYNKDNINAKINAELNKWLTLDFQTRLTYSVIDGLSSGSDSNDSNASTSIVANAVRYRPIDPLTYNSDDDSNSSGRISPLKRLQGTYRERRRFNLNSNVGLNWKPFKNFTFRSEFGYGWRFDKTDQAWNADASRNSNLGYQGRPQAILTHGDTRNWRNANTFTYDNKKLFHGRDRINILFGHEISSS